MDTDALIMELTAERDRIEAAIKLLSGSGTPQKLGCYQEKGGLDHRV